MVGQACRNCGAAISGEYCSQCGQREGRADQRFFDALGDLLGDVLDFDSRFWRTFIYLLIRPGFLSAEFIAGRRARYLPPLRLYLVISFLMFLALSLSLESMDGLVIDTGDESGSSDELVVVLGSGEAPGAVADAAPDPNAWHTEIGLADDDSPAWLKEVDQRAEHNVRKLREDPREFTKALLEYLPQLMFLLLPLFALLIQLAYLFSPFHYLQHLVFALHYHSFVFLLYLIGRGLALLGADITGWLYLALVAYLPLALRRTYGSGWGGALGKALFVYTTYFWLLVGAFSSIAVLALVLL